MPDQIDAATDLSKQHLAIFDTLDFEVFSKQEWARFHESHSQDVIVHWPDGHVTNGLDKHIEDMKSMFLYAPDTRITVHHVRLATGTWTSVIGVMEGSFTDPMLMPDGKIVQPTGKAFKLPMCTIAHWTNGVLDQEYLFGITRRTTARWALNNGTP